MTHIHAPTQGTRLHKVAAESGSAERGRQPEVPTGNKQRPQGTRNPLPHLAVPATRYARSRWAEWSPGAVGAAAGIYGNSEKAWEGAGCSSGLAAASFQLVWRLSDACARATCSRGRQAKASGGATGDLARLAARCSSHARANDTAEIAAWCPTTNMMTARR